MHPIRTYFCQMAAVLCLILNTFVFFPAQQASSKAHTGWLRAYALSANNKYLVTAGSDGQLGVWDYLSGRPLIFFPAHTQVIADVAISADEQFVFSVDESGEIKKWQILSGKQLLSFQAHTGVNVTKERLPFFTEPDEIDESSTRNQLQFPEPGVLTPRLAAHKNGYLLSGGQDALLKLWDSNTGKLLWSTTGHQAPILALGISPDGKYCLSYAQDEVLKVWDTQDGKLLNTLALAEAPSHPLSFSAFDQQLVLFNSNAVATWTLPALQETSLFALSKPLWALAGGSIGTGVWYAPALDSIALYQMEQKKVSKKFKIGPYHSGLAVDKQGRVLFLDEQEKLVNVFDPLKASTVLTFGVLKPNIQEFKFSIDGKYLLLNDGEERVTVMDWTNPASIPLKHFPLNNPSRKHFFSLDDQNQKLLTSSSRGDINIWDLKSNQVQSFDNDQIRLALNAVWIKGSKNFAAWDADNGAFIYTGKNWLNVPRFSTSKDEAAIKAGNYIFQTPLTVHYHSANDFFIPQAEREKGKKYGIYKHISSSKLIYNQDSTRSVFVSKGSLLGIYNWNADKLEREDLPVQYAAWVGDRSNTLLVIEDDRAYIKNVAQNLKLLQYTLPKAVAYAICPSGAHFLLLTPEQELEIREVLSGKLLATLSWKVEASSAQLSFSPAANALNLKQWAQLQALISKPSGTLIQQRLNQLDPHSQKKTTGVDALLPNLGLPTGSSTDLIFTKDNKTLVGLGYSALTIWDLPSGRARYVIEDENCREVDQMLSTDDPKIVHLHFKHQSEYSFNKELNTTYWALNVETGKIDRLTKKADEALPSNQLNSKSQDVVEKPAFIVQELNKWTDHRLVVSPRKTYLAFAYNKSFELWDNQKQQLIYKRPIDDKVADLLFDESEKQLAISTHERVQVIDLSADKVVVEFNSFAGSLPQGPTILETGEVVYSAGYYHDKSILSIFNLPNATMSHVAAHSVGESSTGRGLYSSWFNGHENVIHDGTGDVYYSGITKAVRPVLSKNKKYLAFIDPEGALVIWDNQTRQAKHHIKAKERYEYVGFDERDSLIVAHTAKNIELYHLSSGKKIHNIPLSKNLRSRSPFHFSANSRYLAYVNPDYHVSVWDLKTLQESILPFQTERIIGLSDVSNKIVVVDGEDVAVYPIKGTGRLYLYKLDWSWNKGGRYFPEIEKIVVAFGKKIEVLDVKTGEKLMSIYPSSNNDWVALSGNGLRFETSENGLQQMAYRTTNGQIVPFTKKDPTFYQEGMVKSAFKDLPTAKPEARFPVPVGTKTPPTLEYLKWFWEINTPIVAAAEPSAQSPKLSFRKTINNQFLGNDRWIHQNTDGSVQLLEKTTLRPLSTLPGVKAPLSSQISKDQLYWVFIQNDRQICLWSIPEMRSLKTLTLEKALVSALVITPDNRSILAACTDGKIRLYSLPDLQEKQIFTIGKFNIAALAHGNASPQILAVDASRQAHLYKLEADQLHLQYSMQIAHGWNVRSAQFNTNDGLILITTNQQDQIDVIDLKTRSSVFETTRVLMGRPDFCRFDPVDPYILQFVNILEFSKVDVRTGKKVDSIESFAQIHSYDPVKQEVIIDFHDESSGVFDLRSWELKAPHASGKTPPKILYFGDQLRKIYYPDRRKSGIYHEYDWSKNTITASLDHEIYKEKSKIAARPYLVTLKKDSVQISDNQTGKIVKQFAWLRAMPKQMNISKNGRYLAYPLVSSKTTELFDLQLNKVVYTFPFAASSYFFSLNDQYFFVNHPEDRRMELVELATLQPKVELRESNYDGIEVVPSAEHKSTKVLFFALSSNYQFINSKTGQSLGKFYFMLLNDQTPAWAFFAADGRFDGIPDALQQFYYVDEKNLCTVPIDYKNDPKYQPGLLQKLLE